MNMTSSNINETKVYHTPTLDSEGTRIDKSLIPGTKQKGGVLDDSSLEWILNENDNYLIRVTNNSSSDALATIRIFFFEPQLKWYN